jgi:hypothetical protein
MLSILNAVFQFVVSASDPTWSCELTHRDPDIAGTYYLYCSQMSPDGVELITVGRFISDAKAAKVAP